MLEVQENARKEAESEGDVSTVGDSESESVSGTVLGENSSANQTAGSSNTVTNSDTKSNNDNE